jgi:hypothetical protein
MLKELMQVVDVLVEILMLTLSSHQKTSDWLQKLRKCIVDTHARIIQNAEAITVNVSRHKVTRKRTRQQILS